MSVYASLMKSSDAFSGFNRIFCIGLHKTGTSSLNELFLRLGLKAHHGTEWSRGPIPNAFLEHYRAFSDGGGHFWDETQPFGGNHDLRRLDAEYPGSKFILNVRAPKPWLTSKLLHAGWREDTADEGPAEARHENWRSKTEDFPEQWLKNRTLYHEAARDHFRSRPDDFLEIDIIEEPDAMQKLVEFLGLEDRIVWSRASVKANKLKTLLSGRARIFLDHRMPRVNSSKTPPEARRRCAELVERVMAEMQADPEPQSGEEP